MESVIHTHPEIAIALATIRRNAVIESKPSAQQLKEEIDDLRRQWDYLDNEGSHAEKQRIISNQIGHAQKKLKELYSEEY
jgi:chemotaxis regulatin CheY-phosphate phosphatase CheZ